MKSFFCSATFLAVMFGVSAATLADESEKKAGPAPDLYKVKFETSIGDFVVEVHREWAPVGADRFHELVTNGFYDECRFFRVLPDFMVQFGINGDPTIQKEWKEAVIKDDKVTQSNKRGFITFAKTPRPDSRTSQVFINFTDNSRLDRDGFAPFGEIVEGMDVVDKINAEYGQEPDQGQIQEVGNAYLKKSFPKLDYVKKATIVKDESAAKKPESK